ncbi:MAG: 3-dehydroquinate synthase [Dehalococcoidales bacterium]|nr:3-dehydroquinate synthase [Dehalococcoidales bacterium]
MKIISVDTGNNQYDILIGSELLVKTGVKLKELGFSGKTVIITDMTVNELYGQVLESSLSGAGFETVVFTLEPGEKQKTLANAGRLFTHLSETLADRKTPVLAFGGGVIGDLAGFVAANFMRGLPLIQVPTTLLAQTDSSIGGKVAVDHGKLKNMVGAFYQPGLVISDVSLLKTLSPELLSDGLAEVIKYGVICNGNFFEYLEKNIARIKGFEKAVLEYIVYKSAAIKAGIVAQDEKDNGLRNILNFGHTVGHAIETVSNFTIGHGRAVGLGMLAAGQLSHKLGMFSPNDLARLKKIIGQAGLPVTLPDFKIELILQAMQHDKKVTGGKVRFILAAGIGEAVISDGVSLSLVEQVLSDWNEKT